MLGTGLLRLLRRNERGSAAATIVAAAFLLPATGIAQDPARAPAAPVAPAAGPASPITEQSVTVGYTTRAYTFGDSSVRERAGNLSYDLHRGRASLSLEGSSADYRSPGRSVTGFVPTSLRLNVMLRPGDTLSVFGHTRSQPGSLDANQTAALSVAGSSLVDLQSFSFGTQAMLGGLATFAFPVGDLVLSLRGGLEYEPRPSATIPTYWRGTTASGGATLLGNLGAGTLSGAADLSYSSADSLGGKNLYPGGGSLSIRGTLNMPLGNPGSDNGDPWDSRLSAYWISPLNATRTDQPNLLLPVGTTTGLSGMLKAPVGEGSLRSTVELVHTSSSASLASARSSASTSSTGWAAIFGLSGSVPLSSHLDLLPETGYTVGNASLRFTQSQTTVPIFRRGRPVTTSSGSRVSDSMRGWWFGVALSASF